MTDDATLRDQAVIALKKTTVGYRNKYWSTPPMSSQWAEGLALLAQIGAAPPPPPPPPGIAPPLPPTKYTIPAGWTLVTTTAELLAAIAAGTQTIALEDGIYDNAGPVACGACNLYAANLLGAVVRFGISFTSGAAQGLFFQVSDLNGVKSMNGCCVEHVDPAPMTAFDCRFHSDFSLNMGIYDPFIEGSKYARLVFRNFQGYSARISSTNGSPDYSLPYSAWNPASTGVRVLDTFTDIDVSGICYAGWLADAVPDAAAGSTGTVVLTADVGAGSENRLHVVDVDIATGVATAREAMTYTGGDPLGSTLNVTRGAWDTTPAALAAGQLVLIPESSNGTAECGIWIGCPVKNPVDRIKVRNCGVCCEWTGDCCWNTSFQNLDYNMIDGLFPNSPNYAVESEHFSFHLTHQKFHIVVGANAAFNSEWCDDVQGNEAGQFNLYQDGTCEGGAYGIYLDGGTGVAYVTNVTFKGQTTGAVASYPKGYQYWDGDPEISGCTYQMAAGAQEYVAL